VNEKSLHVLERSQIEIECVIEASPRPVSYWIKEQPFVRTPQQPFESMRQNVIQGSDRISIVEEMKTLHRIVSRLRILNFGESDVGIYSCVASNVMGRANDTIHLYG
jgi:Immunoglobulin domain